MADRVKLSLVIFDIQALLALSPKRQGLSAKSAQMSKITNDSLTRSAIRCFIAVPYDNSGRQRARNLEVISMILL